MFDTKLLFREKVTKTTFAHFQFNIKWDPQKIKQSVPWRHHKCWVQDSASRSLLFTSFQLNLGWRKRLKAMTWKCTVEKRQMNATNVIMHPLRQAIWGHIWKHTVEKSQTNATNVIMHLLGQALWRNIWRHSVEKSQTNATSANMYPFRQAI